MCEREKERQWLKNMRVRVYEEYVCVYVRERLRVCVPPVCVCFAMSNCSWGLRLKQGGYFIFYGGKDFDRATFALLSRGNEKVT